MALMNTSTKSNNTKSMLVCRTSKKLLVQGGDSQPENVFSVSDADMFRATNIGGTGNMTIVEFANYFGAQSDDPDLTAKFQT
jgi:hypothetical protein